MSDDHPGWSPEVKQRVWERIEAEMQADEEASVSEVSPSLPGSPRPAGASPEAVPDELSFPAVRHRPKIHRWVSVAAVLVFAAAMVGGVYWSSRNRQPSLDVATEAPRPLTIEDLAERAGNMPYTEPDLPRYLKITETLPDVVNVSEMWLHDGKGCLSHYIEDEGAVDPVCSDGDLTIEGLRPEHLEAIAGSRHPKTRLRHTFEALSPSADAAERPTPLIQLLAWPGIDPVVRRAAFELLSDLGYRVTSGDALVEGPGVIESFEVDPQTGLVVAADSLAGDWSLIYEADSRPLPEP